ncbi:MAG: DUF1343 domain-containing protein [Pirellulaceae bacterium]|nr:DUF1343 domain-containing protein [Pirellulaceae bacterium]
MQKTRSLWLDSLVPVFRTPLVVLALFFSTLVAPGRCESPPLVQVDPESVGMNSARLAAIDPIVGEGLRRGRMPGCVVLIGRRGRIVFHKAYGDRQTKPDRQPMTLDTVFDLASLTKPIATATSVMTLVEQGRVELSAPVARYLPEFAANGKEKITVRQLLTHQGGLIPDNSIRDYDDGPETAMKKIFALKTVAEPGSRFIYTDVGFIVLAEMVKRLTGEDVHAYSQKKIFQPLGMTETGYLPAAALRERAAVTQQRDEKWMRGEVHDPRAFRLGGVAGHAGLFSTSTDLARYARMMVNGGSWGGARVLKPTTVDLMTRPVTVSSGLRGLGWDIRTGYSSNRGDLLSKRAFGHGGFTGTVLWMDPEQQLFFIFLSNRVHPDGKGSVNALAGRIATIAASAIRPGRRSQPPASVQTQTGVDVLEKNEFAELRGRRVGLITNHTGVNRAGVSTVLLLHRSPNVPLQALFSPEHGFAGKLDVANVADTQDNKTGLKVHSLYGKTRKPTVEMLADIDTLVFDIQDIGTRFYTYISTMGLAMEAAAEHQVRFVVLDRPNPIGGLAVQGPLLDEGSESFVGFHSLPVRHGMTVGELARMIQAERKLKLDLQIIELADWRRELFFDATGLRWINPSPNMRSPTQALLYPGVGLIETTNVCVGRGTDTPFEVVGAPWIQEREMAAALNRANLAGVRFTPIRFTPDASKHKEVECGGVHIAVVDRDVVDPLRIGIELALVLRKLHRDDWETKSPNRLLSDKWTFEAILNGAGRESIVARWRVEQEEFLTRRQSFLLYE